MTRDGTGGRAGSSMVPFHSAVGLTAFVGVAGQRAELRIEARMMSGIGFIMRRNALVWSVEVEGNVSITGIDHTGLNCDSKVGYSQ